TLKHIQPERVTPRAQQYAEMLLARLDAVGELQVIDQDQGWRVEQGDCVVELDKSSFALRVYSGDQLLLQSQSLTSGKHWEFDIQLDPTEGVYGLGETTANLNRRGSVL